MASKGARTIWWLGILFAVAAACLMPALWHEAVADKCQSENYETMFVVIAMICLGVAGAGAGLRNRILGARWWLGVIAFTTGAAIVLFSLYVVLMTTAYEGWNGCEAMHLVDHAIPA